jgi:aminoglycoside 6'-N-acetyltransferase
MADGFYIFRRAERTDLPMLATWLKRPHVAKWWRRPDQQLKSIGAHIAGGDTDAFIVCLAGNAIGYLQCYPMKGEWVVAQRAMPRGARHVDMLLGEPNYLGKAHGAALLRQFVEAQFKSGVPHVIAIVDTRNVTAIGCYGRAGFEPAEIVARPAGRYLLMIRTSAAVDSYASSSSKGIS